LSNKLLPTDTFLDLSHTTQVGKRYQAREADKRSYNKLQKDVLNLLTNFFFVVSLRNDMKLNEMRMGKMERRWLPVERSEDSSSRFLGVFLPEEFIILILYRVLK
jgi:hypothetical protein